MFLANSGDAAPMRSLTQRTEVVCTTVGRYALYGSDLVAACARGGTHYCDLSKVHWMRRMIEAHQDDASASGARMIHTCGFDSIPSDLGVYFLQREMRARHGRPCSLIQCRVAGFSGGASGGTIASMLSMMEEAERDPEVKKVMREPYALHPKDRRAGPDPPGGRGRPMYDPHFGQWTAPFVMADLNTKVVRRSNALLDYAYGSDFRYDEAMLCGSGPLGLARASAVAAASAAGMAALSFGPLRRVLAGRLPQPGQGPSREKREAGYFELLLRGELAGAPDTSLRVRVTGDRDPGYGSTAKMLGECSVSLAKDALPLGGAASGPPPPPWAMRFSRGFPGTRGSTSSCSTSETLRREIRGRPGLIRARAAGDRRPPIRS
jgi:short subunit dehydrogenase-like uncharacterized protein